MFITSFEEQNITYRSCSNFLIHLSKAVGDEMDTMQECKYRLDQTAKKYNVSYTVDKDEKEKFIGYIVKDGTQTDLLAMCKKDGDYYSAMFQIPDEK